MELATATNATSPSVERGEAPVTGIVLDVVGRRPLADYTVELRAGQRLERVTTDVQGRFAGAVPLPSGPITIAPLDNEGTDPVPTLGGLAMPSVANAPQTREWKGESLEVVVEVGPVFELTVTTTQVEGAPIEPASSIARLLSTSPGAVDEGLQLRTTVRSDGAKRRWVRFAPLPRGGFVAPCGATLSIEQGDGLWRSDLDVTAMLPARGGNVTVAWKPRARWTGSLRAPGGQPVPGSWLTLTRTSEGGATLERRRTRCDERGRYVFPALEPGDWQLQGSPLRFHEFQSQKRALAALDDSKLNVSLDPARAPLPLAGKVVGSPVVEGVAPPAAIEIVLRRNGETLPQDSLKPEWVVEDGRHVAVFSFAPVPAGQYSLQLVPPAGDEEQWPTRSVVAKAGPDPVTFTRR